MEPTHERLPIGYYMTVHESQARVLYPYLKSLIGDASVSCICDFGCGNGRFWSNSSAVGELHLYDPELPSIRPVLAKLPNKTTIHDSIDSIPDVYFNYVISCLVLMSIYDEYELDCTLIKMRKILKPGGRMLIAITHPCFLDREHYDFLTSFNRDKQSFHYLKPHIKFEVELFWKYRKEKVLLHDAHRPLEFYFKHILNADCNIVGLHELSSDPEMGEVLNGYPSYLVLEVVPAN